MSNRVGFVGDVVGKFINTHLHTHFSLQDSIVKIPELVKRVKELKQPAVAVTDHSNTSAWYELESECKKEGIKPIFGCEFYCNWTYKEKTKDRHHLVMLAKNEEGIKEIQKLMVVSNENFYYKPILSYEYLSNNTPSNVIVTSACSLGTVGQFAIEGKYEQAKETAVLFNSLFPNNYYLELQHHPDYAGQKLVNNAILQIHDETGIPLTVSSDVHILDKEQASGRDVLKACSWHSTFENVHGNSPTLFSNAIFDDDGIISLSDETGFDQKATKKAIKNTSKIADMCNVKLIGYEKRIPKFDKHDKLKGFFQKKDNQVKLGDF